eukprot:TRINITY_DN14422_c0_g1_i1.p1 TRINITY_DN14422_c0_g1~~TRINITY_DN14422_c0_g1_i1.p1  ORF type:complete len:317 (-),score=85.79 TRINITY_DN14422_c0_g1_i1:30-980(-)
MGDQSWCTIESDPGVFTELLSQIGVKGVQLEEIYDLSTFDMKPCYGLIFLFKWRREEDDKRPIDDYTPIFFASQVIPNACATQALLNILLNKEKEVLVGEELTQFRDFTSTLPPELRGLAISNSDLIRKAHNSFARPEPIIYTSSKNDEEDPDVYHFISYLSYNGCLFELDGLKPGPINLGPCTDEDWVEKAKPVIQKRIERYSQSEIRFNLMAMIGDQQEKITREIEALGKQKSETEDKDVQATIDTQISDLKVQLADEEEKRKNWKIENVRRRHNYIPFIMNMLKILAEKGELMPMLERAKAKETEKKKSNPKK